MKDHRRMVIDTAKKMKTGIYMVFFLCVSTDPADDEPAVSARWLMDHFQETHRVPVYVEDFCLNILTNRIPILEKAVA